MSMKIKRNEIVKFWQIKDNIHILMSTGYESILYDNMYIEYKDGSKEHITSVPGIASYWAWGNIPENENENILQLLKDKNVVELSKIAWKYRVSGYLSCCENDYIIQQFEVYARSIKT